MTLPPPRSTLFPYTTLFRSLRRVGRSMTRVLIKNGQVVSTTGATSQDVLIEGETIAAVGAPGFFADAEQARSEEHTSELQSRRDLVCRLLLEKKKTDRV